MKMKIIGLTLTLAGGAACIFGGLFALLIFVAGGDTSSRGIVGSIGLYFCGKGLAVVGLALISYGKSLDPSMPIQDSATITQSNPHI